MLALTCSNLKDSDGQRQFNGPQTAEISVIQQWITQTTRTLTINSSSDRWEVPWIAVQWCRKAENLNTSIRRQNVSSKIQLSRWRKAKVFDLKMFSAKPDKGNLPTKASNESTTKDPLA